METSKIRKDPMESRKRELDFRQRQREDTGCLKNEQINILELRKQGGMVRKVRHGKEFRFHSKHERH